MRHITILIAAAVMGILMTAAVATPAFGVSKASEIKNEAASIVQSLPTVVMNGERAADAATYRLAASDLRTLARQAKHAHQPALAHRLASIASAVSATGSCVRGIEPLYPNDPTGLRYVNDSDACGTPFQQILDRSGVNLSEFTS